MPLHFATEPKNGTALVQKALGKLATRPSPLSERAVDFNALQVQQPHAVYDLRADAIAHGDGLASAKASGFRYLIGTVGTTVAAAEVLADANGNATLLANVNHGPYVEATARALAQVATLSAVGAGSYEVRLLRFSAIGLMALWLKPDAGGGRYHLPARSRSGWSSGRTSLSGRRIPPGHRSARAEAGRCEW
jgi:hypothetical protein